MTVAVDTATMFASCGDDETPTPNPGPDPDDEVTMGEYKFDYPDISSLYWPDTERGIEAEYDLYIQGLTSALSAVGAESGKEYKWDDILASKERVQRVFNAFPNFEYEVQLCKSLRASTNDVTLTAEAFSYGFVNVMDYE